MREACGKALDMSVPGYAVRAACHGRRPSQFAANVSHERPMLVAQLLKDREVARFVVAPGGYGKTCLAVEYAESIHSWAHVFWFNAQSPCFVRDLDAGVLASSCFSLDKDSRLVVFDDVPSLDMMRQKALSDEIDKLLEKGCEVIVTCVPSCDLDGSLQRDRLRMGAASLLLDDDEIDSLRSADEKARRAVSSIGPAQRVPLLAWSMAPDRNALFISGCLHEDVPGDVLLAMASMFVLGAGTVASLSEFGSFDETALRDVFEDYPHFGFDSEFERFDAPSVGMDALAVSLKKRFPRLVSRSLADSPTSLVEAWASALVREGRPGRACALVDALCPRRSRASWVLGQAAELVRQACFFPMLRLVVGGDAGKGNAKLRLAAIEALCRRVLGDDEGAMRCAKRVAFNDAAPEDARLLGSFIVARLSPILAKQARSKVDAVAEGGWSKSAHWTNFMNALEAAEEGLPALSRFWLAMVEAGASDEAACVCASWMFSMCAGLTDEADPEVSLGCRRAERFVRARLAECASSGRADYLAVSAGLSLEEAHVRGMALDGGPLETSTLMLLRRVEMDVLSQRRQFEESDRAERARRENWVATHPSSLLNRESVSSTVVSERAIPLLTLRLFGLFEVSIGDRRIEYSCFKRQNTRALLVLLAVNQGRELSREAVSEAMWPRSSADVAHRNFYTVWAHLRRAISLPDGTCPYLVRHRYGCSLDTRFVQSDVERLNEICRELLFSVPDIERWSLLFSEIDRDFSSDLMPSERKNALIMQARDDFRSRLVDALVAATMGVIDANNPQWGVWFARAAIARDETREDAYVALMRAQIAGNQRTAAMMTYLNCRRALSDCLGIDPSPETTALYEGLLGGE